MFGAQGVRGKRVRVGRDRPPGRVPRVGAGLDPPLRSGRQYALDALPFVIMASVALAAVWIEKGSELLPLLALGPAFAAVSGGVRKTVVAGTVAFALCALMAAYQMIGSWDSYALDSATVAGVTVAAVMASTLRARRARELAEVRAIAEVAQQVVLGPIPDEVSSVRLAVRYMSATSHAQIGGDLYEVVPALDGCPAHHRRRPGQGADRGENGGGRARRVPGERP